MFPSRITKKRCRRGLSLIDIMVSTSVLLIAVIGTSQYRYFATLGDRKADLDMTAARVGLMLCENWRGLNGDEDYDPVANLDSNLNITESEGPEEPEDYTPLGSYRIHVNNCNYYATLSWNDVQPGLRALNITMVWSQRSQGSNTSLDDALSSADESFEFTTYTAYY